MNFRRLVATVIILSLLLTQSIFASDKLLVGKDYFSTLHKALEEAQGSIYVAMYIISLPSGEDVNNPVSVLVDDLVKAKKRGVYVKVVLDDTKFNVNYRAFRKLKEAGVDIGLDSPGKLMHGKGIVIDKRLVFIGSTNWTRASIRDNHEFTILVDSTTLAEDLIGYISGIKLNPDIPLFGEAVVGVNIPSSLITGRDGLSSLLTNHAEKSFDLYLYIVKKAKRGSLKINYEELGKYLGYTKDYYFNVRQPLNVLIKKYRLLDHRPWSKYVTLREFGGESVVIPYGYWLYGYDKTLSFKAKYMYLVSILEASSSDRNPYWFRSVKDLARKYHMGERTVSGGTKELENLNILEVYRHMPREVGNFSDRPSNVYRVNGLISREEFEVSLRKLEEEYPLDDLEKARELSGLLNEPNDITSIETFVNLIDEYGHDRVAEVTLEVSSKRLETGFRAIERVILLLKQDRGVVDLNARGKDWLKYIDSDKIELVLLIYGVFRLSRYLLILWEI